MGVDTGSGLAASSQVPSETLANESAVHPSPPAPSGNGAADAKPIEQDPLLPQSSLNASPALPPSHNFLPPPPPLPSSESSFTQSTSRVYVPSFLSDSRTRTRFSQYFEDLPHATSRRAQALIAAASAAVHDGHGDSAASSFYLTPLAECCSVDKLVFIPAPGVGTLEPTSAQHVDAAQKTAILGAILALAGLLMMIFPFFPTRLVVFFAGICLLAAGAVSLASFALNLPDPEAYYLLFLALFQLPAGLYMLWEPTMSAFWVCILLAAWLIAKGVGRLSAWRNLHGVDGPPFWRVPHKSGLTLLLLGCFLAVFSRYFLYLLGMLFGWDFLLTGLLLGAAGLHGWRTVGQSGARESDPLVQPSQHPVTYTV